jgi:hypothetical protein
MYSAPDISKNSLDKMQVSIGGKMHKKAGLLDDIRDIWSCDGNVLKCPG